MYRTQCFYQKRKCFIMQEIRLSKKTISFTINQNLMQWKILNLCKKITDQ